MGCGLVTLGEVASTAGRVEIACRRCHRRGVLRTDRLVAEYGGSIPIPTEVHQLTADYLQMRADKMHDVCGVHMPSLSRLMAG